MNTENIWLKITTFLNFAYYIYNIFIVSYIKLGKYYFLYLVIKMMKTEYLNRRFCLN